MKKVRSDPTVSVEIAQPLALDDISRLETLKGAVRRISSAISGRVLLCYWRRDSSGPSIGLSNRSIGLLAWSIRSVQPGWFDLGGLSIENADLASTVRHIFSPLPIL